MPNDMLADLRISSLKVTRFAYHAAPHRVDLETELAEKLLLD